MKISGSLHTTGSIEFSFVGSGTGVWASSTSMNVGRSKTAGMGACQDSVLAVGGQNQYNPSACRCINNTEAWDGTSWTHCSVLQNGRNALAAAGTTNSGLAFGGYYSVGCTESWNGSAWSNESNFSTGLGGNNGLQCLAGAGTQNAALAFAGNASYYGRNYTFAFDGSAWSSGGNLIVCRAQGAGFGIQNAALAVGGYNTPNPSYPSNNVTEEYNGSSWSLGGNLISGMMQIAGVGTQNAGLAFAGNYVEEYNGTSWSTANLMSPSHCASMLGGAGTQASALAFGGYGYPVSCNAASTYTKPTGPQKAFEFISTTGNTNLTGSLNGDASQAKNNNSNSGSLSFWQGSSSEYSALSSYDDNTIYFVV